MAQISVLKYTRTTREASRSSSLLFSFCHLINLDGGVDCAHLLDVGHLPDARDGVQHVRQGVAGIFSVCFAVHISLQHPDKLFLELLDMPTVLQAAEVNREENDVC